MTTDDVPRAIFRYIRTHPMMPRRDPFGREQKLSARPLIDRAKEDFRRELRNFSETYEKNFTDGCVGQPPYLCEELSMYMDFMRNHGLQDGEECVPKTFMELTLMLTPTESQERRAKELFDKLKHAYETVPTIQCESCPYCLTQPVLNNLLSL